MAEKKQVFGNHPFPPEQKRPTQVRGDLIHTFIYPPGNPAGSDLNLLYVSTDKLSLGTFQLSPGATFDPPDIHAGDEVYYILDGRVTQQNTEYGEFVEIPKGDAIFMPKGAYHKSYNYESTRTRMLFVLAPRPWEGQAPPVEDLYQLQTKTYKHNTALPGFANEPEWHRHGTTDDLGSWPVDGPKSREFPRRFYHIPNARALVQVHGTKMPMLVRFFVSNDYCHVGEFILPTGGVGPRLSEPDSHRGDLVLFVVEGPITVLLPDTEDVFNVGVEEAMLIPEGTRYQLINYTDHRVKAIFAIAPGL